MPAIDLYRILIKPRFDVGVFRDVTHHHCCRP